MPNNIVTVNVSQVTSPTPSTLQRSGAIISAGGTTRPLNSLTLLTKAADLSPILEASRSTGSLVWNSSVVTVTTVAPHGYEIGTTFLGIIAGVTPAGYNGKFPITITGAQTFTYPLVSNPGAATVQGTVTIYDRNELLQQVQTFFDQGSAQPVYVLELGEAAVTTLVGRLATWINNNPDVIYSYLVPREWDADSTFLTFLGGFNLSTSKTYFHVTTTVDTYTSYPPIDKCLLLTVQAPAAPASEFTAAAQFYVTLNYRPSSTTKVSPLSFSFVYNVTPYPLSGNGAVLDALKAYNVGYVGTGAEGGLSNTILFWGNTLDGKPFNYWYAVDWAQINLDLALANAVILGSNTSISPLYYDQNGINRLQDVATDLLGLSVTYGLGLGTVVQTTLPVSEFIENFNNGDYRGQLVINAEPFLVYTEENPDAFPAGLYGGFTAVFTPSRGFTQIVFNLNATNFV